MYCRTTAFLLMLLALATPVGAQHEHDHGQEETPVKKPRVFLDKSPRIVEYQLRRLSNEQLLLIDRGLDDAKYLPVYRAILLRPGMSIEHREQALAGLQAINKSTAVDELLSAIGTISLDDKNSRLVFRQLSGMLLTLPENALKENRAKLREATESGSEAVRLAGYASLLTSGDVQDTWSRASGDESARLDFLNSVNYVRGAPVRSTLRGHVVDCLSSEQPVAVRRAALRTLADIPARQKENFEVAAEYVKQDPFRATAVQTLLEIPKSYWPVDKADSLLATLVSHVESIPAGERTSDQELDGLQLADSLLSLVPVERSRSYRDRLRAVTVRVVRINTVHEEMRYDLPFFAVEASRPVQVVLRNHDAMPHNLVLAVPGGIRDVVAAAAQLGNQPGRDGKLYVPDVEQVMYATEMVQPDKQARLVFDAPAVPGEYPFVCTFPRHWMRMYGVMVVVEDLDAWSANPKEPADPLGNTRKLVKNWTPEDFPDLASGLRGRSVAIGGRIFKEATCAQCHKMRGEGGAVGPELTDVLTRWKGDGKAVLREMLDPSYKIDPKYAVHSVLMDDGKVFTGIIKDEGTKTITMVTNPEDPKPQVFQRNEIDEIIKTTTSMMPKGLLDRFTYDEIFELLTYVQSGGVGASP